MPATLIKSLWSSGNLYFYEKTVGRSVTGDVLSIATGAVTVGGTSQDVDFGWYATGSKSFVLDAGAGTLTIAGVDVTITGDLTIDTEDINLGDGDDLEFGDSQDTVMRWHTGDSDNHTFVIGLDNTGQQMHITDKAVAQAATDWARSAGTHPELAIHSNTTPITDYLAIGNHDGTTAHIDVVGGTTLSLDIAGTPEVVIAAASTSPATTDSNALGTASLMWSDLFLADAGVINWNNGAVTLTGNADNVTMAGGGLIIGATATGLTLNGASTSTAMLISGTWGSSANYGAITLAGDAAGTPLALGASATSLIGVRIDLTAAVTAGNDFMGIHSELETSGAMVDGFIIGTYQRVRVAHVAYENYAMWGRMDVNVAQTGDTGNQYLGVFGSVNFAAGAHALLATGGGYGVLGTASIASGGTLDQPLIAGYFDCNAVDNIAGVTLAVRARMQNYTDYGVEAFCQTSNATAGFHIRATAAAALPVGILFTGENVGGQGSITKAFKFAAATNCGIAANTNTLTLTPTSHHIVVDIAGTDYYVPIFDTNTWN